MSDKYILHGQEPVLCNDLYTWARWFENADRRVTLTARGSVKVSTVFLGLDHAFGDGAPKLFETMIFGGEHDQYQERCSTWSEAEAMHARACALAGLSPTT